MSKEFYLSQSMIKDWWDYKKGLLCGNVFKAKYFDHIELPSSEIQAIGKRFEYECTGALDYHGKEPPLVTTERGYEVAKMRYVKEMVPIFKAAIKHYKVEDIEVNKVISCNMGDYHAIVHPDIFCKMDGKETIIDIKTTGLLDGDFRNEYSWNLEGLSLRDKLIIQAVHTKVVVQEALYIENIPFYWWVFSNNGDKNARFIQARISIRRLASHINLMDEIYKEIDSENILGFSPKPGMKDCSACDLFDDCKDCMIIPNIDSVEIE